MKDVTGSINSKLDNFISPHKNSQLFMDRTPLREIQRSGVRVGSSMYHKIKQTALKGKRNVYIVSTLPLPQASKHHAERSLPEPTFPPTERESPRVASSPRALWVNLWEAPLWFYTTGITGQSAGLNHWESDWDGEGSTDFQWLATGC